MQGESKDVNQYDVKEWHSSVLPRILKEYQPKDIFNADETGLFYKLLPNKTYTYKGDQCSGGKKSKERLTRAETIIRTNRLVGYQSTSRRQYCEIN